MKLLMLSWLVGISVCLGVVLGFTAVINGLYAFANFVNGDMSHLETFLRMSASAVVFGVIIGTHIYTDTRKKVSK